MISGKEMKLNSGSSKYEPKHILECILNSNIT